MKMTWLPALGTALAVATASPAHAQCPIPHGQKIGSPDPSIGRFFGDALAVDGDTLLIGAQFDDYLCPNDPYCDAGSVEVWRRSGGQWRFAQRLAPANPAVADFFGKSLAISGDRILIGAYGRDSEAGTNSGVVYDYRFDGTHWVEHGKIRASDHSVEAWFGWALRVDGDVAVITAQLDGPSGAAYVYRFVGGEWIEEQKLVPSDQPTGANFGHAVAIDAGVIAVGANDTVIGGAVYLFREHDAGWIEEQRIDYPDARSGARFGDSVALAGGRLLVGATTAFAGLFEVGDAHIFRYADPAWLHEARLVPSDPRAGAAFGYPVALSRDLAVVGAIGHDEAGDLAGQAYVFARGPAGWVEAARLRPDEVNEADTFGTSVLLQGDEVLVGADGDDSDACAGGWCLVGAVYVFQPLANCDADGAIDLCAAVNGAVADCNENLIPDSCEIADAGTTDCNDNQVLDECDLSGGTSPDCNGNRVPDSCDLATAASRDCNANGSPDECDIGNGGEQDCNVNGVPDSCDLLVGVAHDCDGNGMLDGCEPLDIPQTAKLTAWTGRAYDEFAGAVSLNGDVAVVGAYRDDEAGSDAGAAYVYRWNGVAWVQEQKLIGNDTVTYDWFGCAVAASGNVIVVGAYGDNDAGGDSGSAYVFRFDGANWIQDQKLTASDARANAAFGWSVAADGDRLLIGAYRDRGSRGAAYVYRSDGAHWVQEAKLAASDADLDDHFGWSVAIDGDVAVVGAEYEDEVAPNAGAAYVYRFNGVAWVQQDKLTAIDSAAFDYVGSSVAVSGDVTLVGALRGITSGVATGAAYVFRFDPDAGTWPLETKLTASDARGLSWFGGSVALRGESALIGAYETDVGNVRSGAAYLFRFNGVSWIEANRLASMDGERGDEFGYAVALDSGRMLIGARFENERGTQAGAAYVFGTYFDDCDGNSYPDDCDIASGAGRDVNADCVPDECQDPAAPPLDFDRDGVPDGCDLCLLTVVGSRVDVVGCPPMITGDFDRDGDVDSVDLNRLHDCTSGPSIPQNNPGCQDADLNDRAR